MDNKKDTECSQQHPPISEETLCTTSDLQSISYPEAQLILETSHRPHKPQVTTSLLFSFSPPPIEVWLSWQKSALECQTSGKCKSTTESWERERERACSRRRFSTSQGQVPTAPHCVTSGMIWGTPRTTEHHLFPHWPWSDWLGSKGILITSCIYPKSPGTFQSIIHLLPTNDTINLIAQVRNTKLLNIYTSGKEKI